MTQARVTVRQLQAFVSLAKIGNFHKCAEAIGQSQSALSASIKQLEKELGFALIDRTTRHVELSAVGGELLPDIERILADIASLNAQAVAVAEGRAGPIRIVGLHSITTRLLPPVIAEFAATHPGVRFTVTEHTTSEVLHELSRGAADVAFTSFRAHASDLVFEPLLSDSYQLVAPKKHPLAKQRVVTWDDIAQYQVLALNRGTYTRDLMDELLQASGKSITPVHEAFHFGTIEQYVLHGMGIAAVPALLLGKDQRERLTVRPITDPEISRHLGIIRRRRGKSIPALEEFLARVRCHVATLDEPGLRVLARG